MFFSYRLTKKNVWTYVKLAKDLCILSIKMIPAINNFSIPFQGLINYDYEKSGMS